MNHQLLYIMLAVFLIVTALLGYLGYRHTRSSKDYLVAGGNVHPVLMALAYGSTFISTSAIVGFGGAAGVYGLSLLWLTFFNIFVGILIAFVFFGTRTRIIAHQLKVYSFPEFLGKRFQSTFIRRFSAGIISLTMPLYAAAVMIGGSRYMEEALGLSYHASLSILAVIVLGYVYFGGLKGVIYNDTFQSSIMFFSMAALIILTYVKLGGITEAHSKLDSLKDFIPAGLVQKGLTGWASMPVFGSEIWWFVVSTLVLGVGIGVLAQPQLAVRYMTVSSSRDLSKALGVGAVFILFMTGVAFTVGALSNVHFIESIGKTALAATASSGGPPNVDKIIPLFIAQVMPEWLRYMFLFALLSAAMSTLSGQFHMIATSVSYDLNTSRQINDGRTLFFARAGTVVGFILTIALSVLLPPGIIAIATALFFGFCAAAFLPMYTAALYWPRVTPPAAVCSMLTATLTYLFLVLFIHEKEAAIFGLARQMFGVTTIGTAPWTFIDPLVITLPVSTAVLIAVSLLTKPVQSSVLLPALADQPADDTV